jgi:hypothetical protein
MLQPASGMAPIALPVERARGAAVELAKEIAMLRCAVKAATLALALSAIPLAASGQSGGAGGAASGPTGGTGSAVGSPNAGSAGAGTSGVSGVPSGPANAGGLNNSANDPSGAGNAAKLNNSPPAPGTNSAGTAQSSGSAVNAQPGVTTGSAGRAAPGTDVTGPQKNGDAAIEEENKTIDRKVKSICRGC